MINKVKTLYNKQFKQRSDFFKTALKLSIGTGIAGLIPILLSPVLTKYFSPAAFGDYAIFMSLINFGASFIALKYEMTIILAKEEKAAINLFSLSVLTSLLIGSILLIIGFLFNSILNNWLKLQGWIWIPTIVINLILYNFYQSTFFWCSRKKKFNNIVINRILQNGLVVVFQLMFALIYINNSTGLLFGRTLGFIVSAILFGRILLQPYLENRKEINLTSIKKQAIEFIAFPKHMVLSQSMAVFYAQIPVWYINHHYSNSVAGNFSLAFQIVTIPTALVVTSLGDTFRQYATDMYNSTGRFDSLVLSTIKKSFYISFVPFIIFYFFSEKIFLLVYGESWKMSGQMAAILILMVMINVITNPVDNSAIIVQKTRFIFFWHLSRLLFNIGIVWLCNLLNQSVFYYLYSLVLVNILHYLISLYFMYKFSKGNLSNV